MRLKVSSAKWRPFCLGLNVLKIWNVSACVTILFRLLYQTHKSHNAPTHIPQYTIQNRNVHISFLNGVLQASLTNPTRNSRQRNDYHKPHKKQSPEEWWQIKRCTGRYLLRSTHLQHGKAKVTFNPKLGIAFKSFRGISIQDICNSNQIESKQRYMLFELELYLI